MITHYRNGHGRTACRILSSLIEASNNWGKVNCNACKHSTEYAFFMERAGKIK
jgi:hypothetical protein